MELAIAIATGLLLVAFYLRRRGDRREQEIRRRQRRLAELARRDTRRSQEALRGGIVKSYNPAMSAEAALAEANRVAAAAWKRGR